MGLRKQIEGVVASLGFELVALERGGGRRRPLFRLRIDRAGGTPGRSEVTVEDCAQVSAAVNRTLEESADAPEDYILEVSSPGVERPLVRPGDFDRFSGRNVVLRGYAPLVNGEKEVRGVLLGRAGEQSDQVAVEVAGQRHEVPLEAIAKARLEYRWEDDL